MTTAPKNALGPTNATAHLSLAVVVPCFNVADTLAAQLDALTVQTWRKPWGIVVVDNGSTDDTALVAAEYRDRGVRVVSAVQSQGVAYARNAGVRATRADAVVFCDGDDVVWPGWVAALGDALENSPVVSGQLSTKDINPDWLADARPMGAQGKLPTFGRIGFVSGCNCGVQRQLFDSLNGFDEDFVGLEDIEFSLRVLASGAEIKPIEEAIVSYRLRPSLSATWRQGLYYGIGRPHLIQQARELALAGPGRFDGWRSWAWLVVNLPLTVTRTGRTRWIWVLANRIGVARGSRALGELYI